MTDVVYVVSHGFAARMVTQTNLLGLLASSGQKVALIAPDGNDSNLKSYCERSGVTLRQFNPQIGFWTSQYHEIRKYILEDIKTNPALWEKHVYATRYQQSFNPWSFVRPRLFMLVYYLTKIFPSFRRWFKNSEDNRLNSNEAENLLAELQPQVLVSTYPVNFSEAMLIKAAKNNGTKTVIHLLSWDNISCKGHFPQLSDDYIAWGQVMKEELMTHYGVSEERIQLGGVPHFDIHLNSFHNKNSKTYTEELGLDPDQPYIFFGMSSPRFAPMEVEIVEWLAGAIRKDSFGDKMQMIVRPHPQNLQGGMADESWLPRLEVLHGSRVGVCFPDLVNSNIPWSMQEDDMKKLSQLLAGCAVSLNSGSTLSIDALMCRVPVILTSFDGVHELEYWKSSRRLIDYKHLRNLVNLGGVSVVYSLNELSKMLLKYISDPEYNIDNRLYTVKQYCLNYEHQATEMIVQSIFPGLMNNNYE